MTYILIENPSQYKIGLIKRHLNPYYKIQTSRVLIKFRVPNCWDYIVVQFAIGFLAELLLNRLLISVNETQEIGKWIFRAYL